MGCTINTIDHGVPAESEVGAEGSAYALETLRIKKNAYFGKTALILQEADAAASDADLLKCCALSGSK